MPGTRTEVNPVQTGVEELVSCPHSGSFCDVSLVAMPLAPVSVGAACPIRAESLFRIAHWGKRAASVLTVQTSSLAEGVS